MGHLGSGAVLGDIDVGGEGGAADGAEVDGDDAVVGRAEVAGDLFGGDELVAMALAVVEGEGVAGEAGLAGYGENGGAVEAAGEEDDGAGFGGGGHGAECRKDGGKRK